MVQRLSNILCLVLCLSFVSGFSQDEGVKSPKYKDYKSDTSYENFSDLRFKVAKAQINALKNGGALLVRLKTNSKTIVQLRAAGKIDLATELEQETILTNKIIVASYLREFKFCPVYFFFSNNSDSVKHKNLTGILVDSNLVENSAIVCNASFYLIAEAGGVYNSSLGIASESEAATSVERGNVIREAPIVIKNRYFIQLHKPFPYFQIKKNSVPPPVILPHSNGLSLNLNELYYQINKLTNNSKESKNLKGLRGCVNALNERFEKFYLKNADYKITNDLKEFVY
jgi:hypothetical protein